MLLIEFLDEAVNAVPRSIFTVYVDDVTIEVLDKERFVVRHVVRAVTVFTDRLIDLGMEFSATKNKCTALTAELGVFIVSRLPRLRISVQARVRALGLGLGASTLRHAGELRRRLDALKEMTARFKALKRAGANVALVLRTGGTSALTFGSETMGVSSTLLLQQRRAVAADHI